MRIFTWIIISLASFVVTLRSQTHPLLSGTLKPGGVNSRNMELVDIVPFHTDNEDQFEVVSVPYQIGENSFTKQLLISAWRNNESPYDDDGMDHIVIRIVDVTNPRVPIGRYILIQTKGVIDLTQNPIPPHWGNFGISTVYKNSGTPSSESFNGDVFIIAWVGDKFQNTQGGLPLVVDAPQVPDPESGYDDLKAKYLIINLTEAVKLRESGSTNEITIHDPSVRNVTYGGSVTNNANVYLGYVPSDYLWMKEINYDRTTVRTSQLTQGYSPEEYDRSKQLEPHAINVDQNAGFMTVSPKKGGRIRVLNSSSEIVASPQAFIDCYNLKSLTTTFLPLSTTDPVAGAFLPLFTNRTIENTTADFPVALPVFVDDTLLRFTSPRDISICSTGVDKVRLIIGSTAATDRDGETKGGNVGPDPVQRYFAGGIVTCELDYSGSSVVVSKETWWPYDADRENPDRRYTQQTTFPWYSRICHSATPFYKVGALGTPYVLTSDEMATPKSTPLYTGFSTTFLTGAYNEYEISTSSDKYVFGFGPLVLNREFPWEDYTWNTSIPALTKFEDDRRFGGFTRIWKSEISAGEWNVLPRGSGSADGPLVVYDSPESEDPDNLYYSSTRELPTSSIAVNSVASESSTSTTNRLGVNSTHRSHVIPQTDYRFEANCDDVLLSSYSAGVRMINLTDITLEDAQVNEKAFFDFIPRLSYNAWDPYFYKGTKHDNSAYASWNSVGFIGNHFLGVWHSVLDFGSSRVGTGGTSTLPIDEKFVYSMAWGEGKITADVEVDHDVPDASGSSTSGTYPVVIEDPSGIGNSRNWLSDGGFLVLRYFDDKIGGELKGYVGTPGSFSDKPYRTINLQGKKVLERDVVVTAGTTVNLLPGHNSDPGIFELTELLPPGSGTNTVYVDGVLNISIPEGDALGTDITIDVPIVVRPGGVLNVYRINSTAHVIFKQKVTVNSNGTWRMNEGSDVELYYSSHECNGKFYIDGVTSDRALFTGRRNGVSTTPQGSIVKGVGYYSGLAPHNRYLVSQTTNFTIKYADCIDAYFDMDFIQARVNTKDLDHSTFTRSTLDNGHGFLVDIKRPVDFYYDYEMPNPPLYTRNFDVYDCEFTEDISGISVPYELGLYVKSAGRVTVNNTVFSGLKTGAYVHASLQCYVIESEFLGNELALVSDGVTGKVCSSVFAANEFSCLTFAMPTMEFYDNEFTTTKIGDAHWSGGRHWLRNNKFITYGTALGLRGAEAHLRNRTIGTREEEFGFNDFHSPTPTFTFEGQRKIRWVKRIDSQVSS